MYSLRRVWRWWWTLPGYNPWRYVMGITWCGAWNQTQSVRRHEGERMVPMLLAIPRDDGAQSSRRHSQTGAPHGNRFKEPANGGSPSVPTESLTALSASLVPWISVFVRESYTDSSGALAFAALRGISSFRRDARIYASTNPCHPMNLMRVGRGGGTKKRRKEWKPVRSFNSFGSALALSAGTRRVGRSQGRRERRKGTDPIPFHSIHSVA